MPEQSHPPYAATAQIQPRQLNRWLDVNAQNGPLRRTSKFITLDAFSQDVEWLGYSDIVLVYNFAATHNFSLKLNYEAPVSPDYTLCISWVDANENVYRYSLWRSADDVIYFELPEYSGQLIKGNFRLEIWSTDSTPAAQTTDVTIYTSVLGDQDYRYGVDGLLATPTSCTSFQDNSFTSTEVAAGNFCWWDINTGLVQAGQVTSWTDRTAGITLVPSTSGLLYVADTYGYPSINTNANNYNLDGTGIIGGNMHHMFFTMWFASMAATGDVMYIANGISGPLYYFKQDGSQVSVTNIWGQTITTTAIVDSTWYIVECLTSAVSDSAVTVKFWHKDGYVVEELVFDDHNSTGTNVDTIIFGNVQLPTYAQVGFNQFVGYDTEITGTDLQNTLAYLSSQITTNPVFALPLTFPTCSQPVPNT